MSRYAKKSLTVEDLKKENPIAEPIWEYDKFDEFELSCAKKNK